MAVFNNQFSKFFKIQELAPKQGPWELKLPRASRSPFPPAPCPPGSLKSPPPAHSMSISLGLTGQPPHSRGGSGLCIICPQMQLDARHFQGQQVVPPRFHLAAIKNTSNESVKGYTAAPAAHRLLVTQTEKGLQGHH